MPDLTDAQREYLDALPQDSYATWAILTLGFAAGVFGHPSVVFYGPLTAFVGP